MRNVVRLLAPLVLAFLGGCFSLGRETTPLEEYVLGGVPAHAGGAASLEATGPALGLRRLDLAPYLAVPAVVVREGGHRIVSSEFHRWAEDLDEGISRALARYLSTRGGFPRVDVAPWAPATGHDYLIQVHVLHFEGVVPREGAMSGEGHMLAAWEVLRGDDGAVVARGTTEHREPGWSPGDYAGLVVLLDRGVDRLASDLTDALGSLPGGP